MGFLIYCIGVVDGVIRILTFGTIMGGAICVLTIIISITAGEYEKNAKKSAIALMAKIKVPLIFFILLSIIIPDSKTIAAMYLIPKIAENKDISELPAKLTKLLELKVDGWVDDLTDKKEE